MKHNKIFPYALLLLFVIILTACGSTEISDSASETQVIDMDSPLPTGADHIPTVGGETELILHSGDWPTMAGAVDPFWEKDYDHTEWSDTPCLYLYVHLPKADNHDFSIFEDELNHQLHLSGYRFHIKFLQCSIDEYIAETPEQLIARREEELGIKVDLYLTYDYLSDMQNGNLLDLTDYLDTQNELYEHYDESIWSQLRNENGRIYGIPTDPVAAGKLGYSYNPQLASVLSIDMADFSGDVTSLDSYFPTMLDAGIIPLCLNLMPNDYLMLSLAGLETYGDIFAVRHEADSWKAVDLWQEDEIMRFYKKLGELKEHGYLSYRGSILSRYELEGTPADAGQYRYCFLQLQNLSKISWFYDVNHADEGGFLETNFLLPDYPAFLYEKQNSEIMVISTETNHPQECMDFLQILTLNKDLRLLLYSGIEGYSYIWENGIQIFDPQKGAFSYGLGLENDLRFWPVEHYSDLYTDQISALNSDVRISASLQQPFDPTEFGTYYNACRQLFEDNALVFLGYYGAETEERLNALHYKLIEAGYLELIEAINTCR